MTRQKIGHASEIRRKRSNECIAHGQCQPILRAVLSANDEVGLVLPEPFLHTKADNTSRTSRRMRRRISVPWVPNRRTRESVVDWQKTPTEGSNDERQNQTTKLASCILVAASMTDLVGTATRERAHATMHRKTATHFDEAFAEVNGACRRATNDSPPSYLGRLLRNFDVIRG